VSQSWGWVSASSNHECRTRESETCAQEEESTQQRWNKKTGKTPLHTGGVASFFPISSSSASCWSCIAPPRPHPNLARATSTQQEKVREEHTGTRTRRTHVILSTRAEGERNTLSRHDVVAPDEAPTVPGAVGRVRACSVRRRHDGGLWWILTEVCAGHHYVSVCLP
jgi:hypothetical protein